MSPFTVAEQTAVERRDRWKKSQLTRSVAVLQHRLHVDRLVPDLGLALAGHTSTHTPQPVQSSGATWIVSRYPWISLERKGLDLNVSGAPSRALGSYTFMRMVAWGQTMAHLPQSMQMSGSKIGISWAMARFS